MTPLPAGEVDRLVSQKEAAGVLGMAVSTLRASREIPVVLMPSSHVGGRKIRRYRLSALYAYIDEHTVDPKADRAEQRRVS